MRPERIEAVGARQPHADADDRDRFAGLALSARHDGSASGLHGGEAAIQQRCRLVHQPQGDLVHVAVAPRGESSANRPLVERALSGTALNLEIDLVLEITRKRPAGCIAEVALEDERHATLRRALGAL